ncbi:hypothetical protein TNCV_92531 [Trichonephila clavipes]|nr:hypothetical protein TNCV_92531 [Trichonephila clavipes]
MQKTGFQMLNDNEIVTSVQEESDPVDDKMEEDEDNNNKKVVRFPHVMIFNIRIVSGFIYFIDRIQLSKQSRIQTVSGPY